MRRWLWHNSSRIAGLIGLLSLSVVDVAFLSPNVANGFWIIGSMKAFHLAITVSVLSFIFVILREP